MAFHSYCHRCGKRRTKYDVSGGRCKCNDLIDDYKHPYVNADLFVVMDLRPEHVKRTMQDVRNLLNRRKA